MAKGLLPCHLPKCEGHLGNHVSPEITIPASTLDLVTRNKHYCDVGTRIILLITWHKVQNPSTLVCVTSPPFWVRNGWENIERTTFGNRTVLKFITMAPRNKLCGVCGKTTRDFPSPRLYEEHVKKHLDQTYSCDKCDIKFETKISLYDHLSSEQVVEVCSFFGRGTK